MQGERHIAMLAMRYPATLFAFYHRCISTTILEQYHLLATSVRVYRSPTLILGHELELTANYRPFDWMTISAGYTFMQGTKTMEMVKRTTEKNQCHWAYIMVTINPTFVKVRF